MHHIISRGLKVHLTIEQWASKKISWHIKKFIFLTSVHIFNCLLFHLDKPLKLAPILPTSNRQIICLHSPWLDDYTVLCRFQVFTYSVVLMFPLSLSSICFSGVATGLGEMMPAQLWETTMDPERRLLKQLRVEDAAEANVVFSSLMGTRVSNQDS